MSVVNAARQAELFRSPVSRTARREERAEEGHGTDAFFGIVSAVYAAALGETSWQAALEVVGDAFSGAPVLLTGGGVHVRTYARAARGPSAQDMGIDPLSISRGTGFYQREHILEIGHQDPRDCPYTIRVIRPPAAPPFSSSERKLFGRLVPHLVRALALYARQERLTHARRVAEYALNQARVGIVVLTRAAFIVRTNEYAREMFAANDGLAVVKNKVEACVVNEAAELRNAISKVSNPTLRPRAPVALAVTRPSGRVNYHVLLAHLDPDEWPTCAPRPTAVMYVRAPDAQVNAEKAMAAMLGLTPRERAIALCLFNGLTRHQTAEHLKVTLNTVRTHLGNLLGKACVNSQRELVRLLCNSVIAVA